MGKLFAMAVDGSCDVVDVEVLFGSASAATYSLLWLPCELECEVLGLWSAENLFGSISPFPNSFIVDLYSVHSPPDFCRGIRSFDSTGISWLVRNS